MRALPAALILLALPVAADAASPNAAPNAGMQSQVNRPLAAGLNADTTAARVKPHLTQRSAQWVHSRARLLAAGQIELASVEHDAANLCTRPPPCIDIQNMSVEEAVMAVMMLVAKEAEEELRDQLAEMEKVLAQKRARREAEQAKRERQQALQKQAQQAHRRYAELPQRDDPAIQLAPNQRGAVARPSGPDQLSDMDEMDQMRMQALMDRRAKILDALSNIMKKLSETRNNIIRNMK